MNRSLRLLFLLQVKALLRLILRLVKRPAGTLVALGVILFMGFVGFALLVEGVPVDAGLASVFLPAGALVLLLSVGHFNGSPGLLGFSQGEIDFLFSAPASQRELLLHKQTFDLCYYLAASLVLMLFFHVGLGGLVRAFLFSLTTLMIAHAIAFLLTEVTIASARFSPRLPRLFPKFLLVAGILWSIEVLAVLGNFGKSLFDPGIAAPVTEALRQTTFATVVLLPFEPVRLMAEAADWSGFLPAFVLGVVVCGGIMAAGLGLNADFRTDALVKRERLECMRRTVLSGGGRSPWNTKKPRFGRWPMPRLWGGFGPIAWARLIQGFRSRSKHFLQAAVILPVLAILAHRFVPDMVDFLRDDLPSVFLFSILGYFFALAAAGNLTMGAGDADLLKKLPAKPIAVVAAEIIAPAIVIWLPLTVLAVAFGVWTHQPIPAMCLAAILLPALVVSGAVDLAYRATLSEPVTPESLAGGLHFLIIYGLCLFSLLCAGLIAFFLASTATLLLDPSPWIAFAVAWITLTAIALALLPVAARCFAKCGAND